MSGFLGKSCSWINLALLALVLSLSTAHLQAQSNPNQIPAIDFAKQWIQSQNRNLKSAAQLKSFELLPAEHKNLFLAQFEPTGFLIFFYQNNSSDIVGYSTESNYPVQPDHPLIAEWQKHFQPSDGKNLKSTKGTTFMQDEQVEPLIEARWGQGENWNKFCPADETGQRALVGCVAVAMGQLMKKWNWPERGMGENSYIPSNYPEYGVLSASFDTAYQWNDMPALYATDATALLLYHAGVATFMNYGPNESGANTSVYAPQALKDNFRYFKGMQVREKDRYSEEDWFSLLRQELINDRPVIYFGSNPDGGTGHAFNIDGFHSQDYFHFNWGWNGAGNGYFRLENMAAGGGNFTKGQAAIVWIQPETIPMHDRPGSFQTLPGDGYVQLIWDDLSINDFSHYNIFRNGQKIGTSVTNRFVDTNLQNGQSYRYHLTATYVGANEGESKPTEILVATPSSQMTLPAVFSFEIHPSNWELKNTNSGFRWGSATELQIPGNEGSLVSIRSDLAGSATQVSDYLTSPSLDLRNKPHVAVSLDYVFKQKPGVDKLFLMYRRFEDGSWYPISELESTGEWSDWQTVYFYFPEEAKNGIIQLGIYYNDFNRQGFGAAIDNIKIWVIETPPTPAYTVDDPQACQLQELTFQSESLGEIYSWLWDFGEGAEPRYATDPGPHRVHYLSGGSKTTSLLLNHLDLLVKPAQVQVTLAPIAGFESTTSGLLAEFEDTSKNGTYYWWDFGDGKTSTEKNPQNKYKEFEKYTVTQVIYNDQCEPDTARMVLDFRINSAVTEESFEFGIECFPNPAKQLLNIHFLNPEAINTQLEIINLQGKTCIREEIGSSDATAIDVSNLPAGLYFLLIRKGNHRFSQKIIIE